MGSYHLFPSFPTQTYFWFTKAIVSSLAAVQPINVWLDIFLQQWYNILYSLFIYKNGKLQWFPKYFFVFQVHTLKLATVFLTNIPVSSNFKLTGNLMDNSSTPRFCWCEINCSIFEVWSPVKWEAPQNKLHIQKIN